MEIKKVKKLEWIEQSYSIGIEIEKDRIEMSKAMPQKINELVDKLNEIIDHLSS